MIRRCTFFFILFHTCTTGAVLKLSRSHGSRAVVISWPEQGWSRTKTVGRDQDVLSIPGFDELSS
jgi:hypothetical protein